MGKTPGERLSKREEENQEDCRRGEEGERVVCRVNTPGRCQHTPAATAALQGLGDGSAPAFAALADRTLALVLLLLLVPALVLIQTLALVLALALQAMGPTHTTSETTGWWIPMMHVPVPRSPRGGPRTTLTWRWSGDARRT